MTQKYNTRQKYGQGWFLEPTRHSLARRGISTGRKVDYVKNPRWEELTKSEWEAMEREEEHGDVCPIHHIALRGDICRLCEGCGDYTKSQASYDFFSDPGHGWIKVKRSELERLGIADKISGYSYQKGDYVYLEEDDDGTLFADAKKAHNEPVNLRSHIADRDSKIRSYDSYSNQVSVGEFNELWDGSVKSVDYAKKDWKKVDWISFADYLWYTPDDSLIISSVQDRDGKNAFLYTVSVKSGLSSLGKVHKKIIWKGRDEKFALKKANEYMEVH